MTALNDEWMHVGSTTYGWQAERGYARHAVNIRLKDVGMTDMGIRQMQEGATITHPADRQALAEAVVRATNSYTEFTTKLHNSVGE